MMGIFPITPASPIYTLTTFINKITLHLDPSFYENKTMKINSNASSSRKYMQHILLILKQLINSSFLPMHY